MAEKGVEEQVLAMERLRKSVFVYPVFFAYLAYQRYFVYPVHTLPLF